MNENYHNLPCGLIFQTCLGDYLFDVCFEEGSVFQNENDKLYQIFPCLINILFQISQAASNFCNTFEFTKCCCNYMQLKYYTCILSGFFLLFFLLKKHYEICMYEACGSDKRILQSCMARKHFFKDHTICMCRLQRSVRVLIWMTTASFAIELYMHCDHLLLVHHMAHQLSAEEVTNVRGRLSNC